MEKETWKILDKKIPEVDRGGPIFKEDREGIYPIIYEDDIRRAISDVYDELYETRDRLNIAENTIDEMKDDLRDKEDIIENLQGDIKYLEEELETTVIDRDELTKEVEDLKLDLEEYIKEYGEL